VCACALVPGDGLVSYVDVVPSLVHWNFQASVMVLHRLKNIGLAAINE